MSTITAPTLDSAIARILDALGPPDELAWEVEKLIRAGAVATERLKSREAAKLAGWGDSSLGKALRKSGLPPISTLVGWGRAIAVLDHFATGATTNETAEALGWADGPTVGVALLRLGGIRPGEWRDAGADMDLACDALVGTWMVAA